MLLQNCCVEQHNAGGKPESWVVDLRQYSRHAALQHCMSIFEGKCMVCKHACCPVATLWPS
jgi:hypothetical protein